MKALSGFGCSAAFILNDFKILEKEKANVYKYEYKIDYFLRCGSPIFSAPVGMVWI